MLELYYFENSICSERPLMVLAEKGVTDWVPHHIHLFRGEQFEPDYLALNPKAQVPTLVHDGAVIRESTLICDYLDDLYPPPPLKPATPVERAHMREWIKEADEGGFEGVASLSFVAVFRAKLMAMSETERTAHWAGQTVLERTQRQQSCVFDGFDSPYALRAIATWDRIFTKIDKAIAAGGPWLMGRQFTLADLELATFIARLDGLTLLEPWIAERPNVQTWWRSVSSRPSYVEARVGPSGEEAETMGIEGARVVGEFQKKRAEYIARYGAG
ncbi:MAG: glutathione S-transferase family protein [Rhodospirillaceae bacterium]|nr:glutathione S-transferase family protein [Rhodospirillaceae bacterium]